MNAIRKKWAQEKNAGANAAEALLKFLHECKASESTRERNCVQICGQAWKHQQSRMNSHGINLDDRK